MKKYNVILPNAKSVPFSAETILTGLMLTHNPEGIVMYYNDYFELHLTGDIENPITCDTEVDLFLAKIIKHYSNITFEYIKNDPA